MPTLTQPHARTIPNRIAYSVREASALTTISRSVLYELMRTGQIPYVQIGGRRVLMRDTLIEFLRSLERTR